MTVKCSGDGHVSHVSLAQKVQKAGVERVRAEVEDAAENSVFTDSQQL